MPADWDDLTEWVAGLCRTGSECLPAALWLISTSTSPLTLFEPTARELQLMWQFAAGLEETKALFASVHGQLPEPAERESCIWSDLGSQVKSLFQNQPEQFRLGLCLICDFGRAFGERLDLGQPTDAELESLLADLDRSRPYLLPDVLKMMAAKPSAGALAARWRPPERSRQEIIARKIASFNRVLLKLLTKGAEDADRLLAEPAEMFREHPEFVPDTLLETRFVDLPLGILLAIEEIIDDERLSIPGKAVAVHEQLIGAGPVCH